MPTVALIPRNIVKGTFVDFVRESTSISVEFETSVFKFGKEIGMLYGLKSHTKILGKFIIIHNNCAFDDVICKPPKATYCLSSHILSDEQ